MEVEQKEEIVLTRFRISKNGLALVYWTYEPMKMGSLMMNGEVKRNSPFPPSRKILKQVDRLRYFFAKATGMWYDGFDRYIGPDYNMRERLNTDNFEEYCKAQSTIEAIRVDEVKLTSGYKLWAVVEAIEGKFTRPCTPTVSDVDLIFDEMKKVMENVLEAMREFVRDSKYDIRKEAYDIVFRSIQNKEERLEVMSSMSERDILLNAIEIFESKGALLVMDEELDKEIVRMRDEREYEQKQSDLGSMDVSSEELEKTGMDDAMSFAESESNHGLNDSNGMGKPEQDWAEGIVVPTEKDAKKRKLIVEEFM